MFFGHGPTQAAFENRDLGTTNDCVYNKLQKTEQIIDPHHFELDITSRHKFHCNGKTDDLPKLFGVPTEERKPKACGQYTKSFNANHTKTALRQ